VNALYLCKCIASFYYCNNVARRRMDALRHFRYDQHREEVVGSSLSRYVINGNCYFVDWNLKSCQLHISEYRKARKLLGDTLTGYPTSLYMLQPTPLPDILISLVGDLPMVSDARVILFCRTLRDASYSMLCTPFEIPRSSP
jgi:hypothetical protein